MNIWGSKTLRRLIVPLGVISLGAALSAGWSSGFASTGTTTGTATASSTGVQIVNTAAADPTVEVQSVSFVLDPTADKNFQPTNACGGAPSTQPLANVESGTWSAAKLSVSQNRCTLAIFTPSEEPGDLHYSSTPCPVDLFPTLASGGIQYTLDTKSSSGLKSCTAPAFLSTIDTSLAPGTGAAGQVAIHDWPGSSCKPGNCRLYMELVAKSGNLNEPGLCASAFYVNGPCTAAFVTTNSVAANPAHATIDFSDEQCPPDLNLSLPPIGTVGASCTNVPFLPAGMDVTLPAGMTPNPELQTPIQALPQHSTGIADQAITLELAPSNNETFQPSNACSIDSIEPVNRCTAAIINVPIGFTGGNLKYPGGSNCKLLLAGRNDSCISLPFGESSGELAVTNLPPITCHAAEPAVANAGGMFPVVGCRIYVILTRDSGSFNANNPCGVLSNTTSSVETACLLASANTKNQSENNWLPLTSATPYCVSGGAAAPTGIGAQVTTDCVSAGNAPTVPTSPAFAPAAGSLAADIAAGAPASVNVHIPNDYVNGND